MKAAKQPYRALTFSEAIESSAPLARLSDLVRQSAAMLEAVQAVLPAAIRASVQAGPVDGENWCLLVKGNAAAAKLRQVMPLLQPRLAQQGWKVTAIRLKVVADRR